ncbi:MAG: hypothetical protein OEW68_12640 [Gammaproteobacteria bacterium]|nr:hypothetical protein [Gammaproteobacteria bacterium]MDH4315681.1 hypothetical protein [Gammaproteobacteria bacterium]
MNDKPRKDRAVTVILALIWFGAVALILLLRDDISLYLLGIGTLFFLLLVPSMKELIRNADNFFSNRRHSDD